MKVFAKFDEIPSMILEVIKKQNVTDTRSELQREITSLVLAPSPYFFIGCICLVHMKVFAKFDEIPSMILEVIKETKRYGHTFRITKENNSPSIGP